MQRRSQIYIAMLAAAAHASACYRASPETEDGGTETAGSTDGSGTTASADSGVPDESSADEGIDPDDTGTTSSPDPSDTTDADTAGCPSGVFGRSAFGDACFQP
jgi:hypothetical protein